MRFISIVTLICISVTCFSQTSESISYVSPKQDTLYLVDNEVGKLINDLWKEPLYDWRMKERKPVILLVEYAMIEKLIRKARKPPTF